MVEMSMSDSLGAIIKEAREQAGLTQKELARKVGVCARHIMYIENNHKKPSFKVLHLLICELNLRSDDIFFMRDRKTE